MNVNWNWRKRKKKLSVEGFFDVLILADSGFRF